MTGRIVFALFALLLIASTVERCTKPATTIATACWTAADGQPICRGAIRPVGANRN